MRLRSLLQRLRRDPSGVTIVEFGLVAPVMGLLLLGAFDIAHTLYMRATLQGVLQKAARDSALESGAEAGMETVIDDKVRKQVAAIANNAKIDFKRRYYRTFSETAAARAEAWTDTNKNKTCDANEPYEDANRNGAWDADGGDQGQGGAKDATLYTVTVTYPRFFPIYNLIGGSRETKLVASTVLKNQPYADQQSYGATIVRNCA